MFNTCVVSKLYDSEKQLWCFGEGFGDLCSSRGIVPNMFSFVRKVMKYQNDLRLNRDMLFSANTKQGRYFAFCDTQNNDASTSVHWLRLPMSCLVVYSLPVWWKANAPSRLSLLSVLFSSFCLFQPAWRRQGLSLQWISTWQRVGLLLNLHWLKPLPTPKLFTRHKWLRHIGGFSCKEADVRDREEKKNRRERRLRERGRR